MKDIHGNIIRLPRKQKKKLIKTTARSEYHTQRYLILLNVLTKFVVL